MNPPHPGGSLTVRLRFSFNYRKDSRRSVTAGEGGGGGGEEKLKTTPVAPSFFAPFFFDARN